MNRFSVKPMQLLSCLLLGSVFLVGCNSAKPVDPKVVQELRGKYMLAEEPADPEGVLDLRETLKQPQDVVLIAQVGGVPDPWTKGKASFVVSDPSMASVEDDGQDHKSPGHDPATCPFCSRKLDATKGLALVQFVDDKGQVVAVDARDLFGISPQQLVVVRGRAEQDSTGNLVVSASGLFVRK